MPETTWRPAAWICVAGSLLLNSWFAMVLVASAASWDVFATFALLAPVADAINRATRVVLAAWLIIPVVTAMLLWAGAISFRGAAAMAAAVAVLGCITLWMMKAVFDSYRASAQPFVITVTRPELVEAVESRLTSAGFKSTPSGRFGKIAVSPLCTDRLEALLEPIHAELNLDQPESQPGHR